MVLRDVDVPKTAAAEPVETDRANYNFPIKTSIGETLPSTRKSPRCKKDPSSNVKNVSGLMLAEDLGGNFPRKF